MGKIQISSRTEAIDQILEELFSFHRFGIKPGLENITTLLAAVGDPHQQYRTLHIAGTNGKGTVSSVLASVLMEAGYTVGLYTSPHILRFNERIRVNGREIDDGEIAALATTLLPKTREIGGTFFEATTAMAFRYFADQQVDIAVIETGLGGRLDSTNVLLPLVSIITSIDLDHTDFLGNTLPEIAGEKAGIIKPGIPVIIGEPRRELRTVFDHVAAEQNAPVIYVDDCCQYSIHDYKPDFSMRADFTAPGIMLENITIPFSGEHMARNISTVCAAFHVLNDPSTEISVSADAMERGIAHARTNSGIMGRIELLRTSPPLVLDVSHNSAGVRALVQTLQKSGYADTKWNIIVGAMKDKDVRSMIAALQPVARMLYATAPAIERALTPSELERIADEYGIPSQTFSSVADAVQAALATEQPALISGSFYLADEALRALAAAGL